MKLQTPRGNHSSLNTIKQEAKHTIFYILQEYNPKKQ